jgi:pectin methylesterase-like acyl-CoA thioesterase
MLIALQLRLLPLLASFTLGGCLSPATTFSKCQRKTNPPLDQCPDGTLYVSQNDDSADFTSIQDAIRSLPNDTSSQIILIGTGIYTEQLNVTRSGPVTLLGQSNKPWEGLMYSNVSYNEEPRNEVQIYHNAANHEASYPDNIYTSVLAIGPTYNATQVGAGPTGYPVPANTTFGCSDFRAYNIDFRNEWAPRASGPAHALGVGYANAGFYSCGFYSYQDTVRTSLHMLAGNRAAANEPAAIRRKECQRHAIR